MAALLLDETFSAVIAEQLRAKGHDVLAVVADPALTGLADEQIITRDRDRPCSGHRLGELPDLHH
jgi:hypothetical protein